MAHAAKQVRDAVTALLTGLTTTGNRVYPTRVYPVDRIPCLAIFTAEETRLDDADMMGTEQVRQLTLTVEGTAASTEGLDDVLDQIRLEVETALMDAMYVQSSSTLQTLLAYLVFSSMAIDLSGEHEQQTGRVTMNFEVQYQIDGVDPETIID